MDNATAYLSLANGMYAGQGMCDTKARIQRKTMSIEYNDSWHDYRDIKTRGDFTYVTLMNGTDLKFQTENITYLKN